MTIADSSGNTIGGTVADQGNTIAFNSSDGIDVVTSDCFGDAFLSNAIFSNGANAITSANPVGIYLAPGSNQSIPAPFLASATPDLANGTTTIVGSYSSQASTRFLIQFFSDAAADPAGQYEGQTLLGSTVVTIDPTADPAKIDVDVPTLVTAGFWITATATFLTTTDATPTLTAIETSTFSPQHVQAINLLIVTSTADNPATPGTLPNAINASNNAPNANPYYPNVIEFQIPGPGLQTIELISALPPITEPVVIDGYSQPGSASNTPRASYGVFDTEETDVATIDIQIDGSEISGNGINGLTIAAQNCTIDGLIITGFFSGAGIALVQPFDARRRRAGRHDLGQLHRRDRVQSQFVQSRVRDHQPRRQRRGDLDRECRQHRRRQRPDRSQRDPGERRRGRDPLRPRDDWQHGGVELHPRQPGRRRVGRVGGQLDRPGDRPGTGRRRQRDLGQSGEWRPHPGCLGEWEYGLEQ